LSLIGDALCTENLPKKKPEKKPVDVARSMVRGGRREVIRPTEGDASAVHSAKCFVLGL